MSDNRFYKGAAKIDALLDQPKVDRFMDALAAYWVVAAAIFVVVVVGGLFVAIVVEAIGSLA